MSSSHTLKQTRVNRRRQYMKLRATGRMQNVCNASVTNEFPCLPPTYCCYQEADIQISSTMQRWGTEQKNSRNLMSKKMTRQYWGVPERTHIVHYHHSTLLCNFQKVLTNSALHCHLEDKLSLLLFQQKASIKSSTTNWHLDFNGNTKYWIVVYEVQISTKFIEFVLKGGCSQYQSQLKILLKPAPQS